jgi:hypothetical protein
MPDRPDENEDKDALPQLVLEAGDPTVEPRPEYVADLRALVLDHLGPPLAEWKSRARWLVVPGLAAACLAAVFVWPRGDGKSPGPGSSRRQSSDPITPRPHQNPTSIAAWENVRRDLDLSEIPAYSWPLQEPVRRSILTSIPADLLD